MTATKTIVRAGDSGLIVSLHPLPILSISEHLTRVSLQARSTDVQIIGGLLGTQQGRDIEIMNSFEIVVAPDESGAMKVDHAYFVTRKEQFKQVFPTFDFLGWYSVGPAPTQQDLDLHSQFFEYNESPLFLQLSASTGAKELPVTIYESVVELTKDEPEISFIKAAYEIETGEAERVAVDHASKPSTTGNSTSSSLIASLTTQRNAIKMLFDRVSVIVQYLHAVAAGTAPKDQETLRMISALITSLPATDTPDFREEFMTEYNDVLLTTYLASLTKQLNSANELLDKQLLLVANSARNTSREGGNGNGGGGHRAGGRRGKGDSSFFG